jgi:hypothetical protein
MPQRTRQRQQRHRNEHHPNLCGGYGAATLRKRRLGELNAYLDGFHFVNGDMQAQMEAHHYCSHVNLRWQRPDIPYPIVDTDADAIGAARLGNSTLRAGFKSWMTED